MTTLKAGFWHLVWYCQWWFQPLNSSSLATHIIYHSIALPLDLDRHIWELFMARWEYKELVCEITAEGMRSVHYERIFISQMGEDGWSLFQWFPLKKQSLKTKMTEVLWFRKQNNWIWCWWFLSGNIPDGSCVIWYFDPCKRYQCSMQGQVTRLMWAKGCEKEVSSKSIASRMEANCAHCQVRIIRVRWFK